MAWRMYALYRVPSSSYCYPENGPVHSCYTLSHVVIINLLSVPDGQRVKLYHDHQPIRSIM